MTWLVPLLCYALVIGGFVALGGTAYYLADRLYRKLSYKLRLIMATLQQTNDKLDQLTLDVQALKDAVSAQPVPAATEADLDGIVAKVQAADDAVNALTAQIKGAQV